MSPLPIPRFRSPLSGLILLLLLPVLFSGCSFSYLLHAAAGQIRIQHRAVPIERALADPILKPEEKEALRLVGRVKDFGERKLGLKSTNNYETVYLGDEPNPVYTVTAASRTSLELVTWWFPVVGRMPYLGFFDPDDAAEKKRDLEKKGLDVVIWPADAYSTLGWFQDPVHRNLLEKHPLDLVETILHEMTHATIYAKGQPAFNETLATVIGKRGAAAFLEETFGPDSFEAEEARTMIRDQRRFSSFIDDLVRRMRDLYSRPLTEAEKLTQREKVFAQELSRFRKQELETTRYSGFGSGGINNAYLLGVSLYHRHYNTFEAVIQARGGSISKAMDVFQALSGQGGDLVERTEEWLS